MFSYDTSALHHLLAWNRMDIYIYNIDINYMIGPAGIYLLLFICFILSELSMSVSLDKETFLLL